MRTFNAIISALICCSVPSCTVDLGRGSEDVLDEETLESGELEIPPEDSVEPDNSYLECITYTNRSAEERENFCRAVVSHAYRRECWRHTNDSARGWLAFCAVFVTQ